MPELVMYRFEVGGVESIDIARIQRIEVVEGDFRTALGRTQYDGAVVVVGRTAHEEEVFREVGPDEVPAAGDFVVGLQTKIGNQLRHFDRAFVTRRNQIVGHIGFHVLVTVHDPDIIRFDEVLEEPLVERRFDLIADTRDYALVVESVLRTRRIRKCEYQCGQCKYRSFHNMHFLISNGGLPRIGGQTARDYVVR